MPTNLIYEEDIFELDHESLLRLEALVAALLRMKQAAYSGNKAADLG